MLVEYTESGSDRLRAAMSGALVFGRFVRTNLSGLRVLAGAIATLGRGGGTR